MDNLLTFAQIILGISVIFVWIFRKDNITKEFLQFGLSNLVKNIIGALKISLATILILGIWYQIPLAIPSLFMGFLMICAQYFHVKVKNPWHKFLPSLFLLLLSLLIAAIDIGMF